MSSIGTPFSPTATKVLLCGAGELGKEVIAVDRYENALGMQVADRSHVINMLDGAELRRVIELEKPDFVVPEIEAIARDESIEKAIDKANLVASSVQVKF